MKIKELKQYLVKSYFSPMRKDRNYGLLVLGPPGVGKSMNIQEAAALIAEKLGKKFLRVVIRWNPIKRQFMMNSEIPVDEALGSEGKFFIFSDFRLSTCEPSDLSGPLRSRDGIAYYDPLLWAVLHSANPGILFLDERDAGIMRLDVK